MKTSNQRLSQKSIQLLDPKNDLVFKMLFGNKHHTNILISFLAAVLKPTSPITSLTLLNPNIPRSAITEKEIVLDITAELANDELIDVEMQMEKHTAFRERCLYYWAKLYSKQLKRGESEYTKLRPTNTILVLNFELLDDPQLKTQYHAIVKTIVHGSNESFSEHFKMHIIELPKLAKLQNLDLRKHPVAQWGRFMLKPTLETLDELSQISPVFKEVENVMVHMSASHKAQHMADLREKTWRDQNQRLRDASESGEASGLEKGRNEGLIEGHNRGLIEGHNRGLIEGHNRGLIEAAGGMLKIGLTQEQICKALNMTEQELAKLLTTKDQTE